MGLFGEIHLSNWYNDDDDDDDDDVDWRRAGKDGTNGRRGVAVVRQVSDNRNIRAHNDGGGEHGTLGHRCDGQFWPKAQNLTMHFYESSPDVFSLTL